MIRPLLYVLLAALFILHNDWWFWTDSQLVFGMPIGLTYHVLLCFAAALVMFLLTRYAWPEYLSEAEQEGRE